MLGPGIGGRQSRGEHLRGVHRGATAVEMGDLRPAAEAVGHDGLVRWSAAHRRHQLVLGTGHRDVVVPLLEAEIACQAATPGIEELAVHPGRSQCVDIGAGTEDRMLVAVRLHQR